MKLPKTIQKHPAVREVLDGESIGFDYKYSVELNVGWVFGSGRNAGCDWCNFNTVAEFLDCPPIRREDYDMH
jgi:hypothetical protein